MSSTPGAPGASGPALAAQLLISGLAAGALFWRRQRPVLVVAFGSACTLVLLLVTPHPVFPGGLAFALYAVGRHTRPRVSWTTAAIVGLCYGGTLVGLHAAGFPVLAQDGDGPLATAFLVAGVMLLPILLLVALGNLLRLRHELKQRDRAESAAAAVRVERARIARELHDVVAHHITTMNVLLGAARTVLRQDPGQAEEAIATAEQNGRDAIAELRQLLHVLRAEQARAAEPRTTGVAHLPDLVERAREAGQRIVMEVTGEPFPLPTTVDHAVYRIVQEALTNSRKHASGATATVTLRYLPGMVDVRVADDGPEVRRAPGTEGFGLRGIAERVALCGGELQVGAVPQGGFRVHASIPADQGADRR
ncbi:sensor histidine kinase [Nonomuraea jiangxiensis]|uniref:sensor histidine kinase n=1 Tax=Nonomuraea jiangxiensis TaxID=633440 RepID=UPI000B80EC79|nr:sensor histidine kinase [Nonomuraea jiangxiensis]